MKDNFKEVEIDQFKDEDVIKGFEEILKNSNNKLSLVEQVVCTDVVSLVNRQKKEIETLKTQNNLLNRTYQAAKLRILRLCGQVKHQHNEIETLEKEQWLSVQDVPDILEAILNDKNKDMSDLIFKERNNAIEEFADTVKQDLAAFVVNVPEMRRVVDNIVKEMTEVQE